MKNNPVGTIEFDAKLHHNEYHKFITAFEPRAYAVTGAPGKLNLLVNDTLCVSTKFEQIRFPKTSNRRIKKAFKILKGNYKIWKEHSAYNFNGVLVVSQKILNKLKEGASK